MKKPQSIHSILEKTLKGLEMDVPLKTYSIVGAWNEIVGDALAKQTYPRSIRNRILFLDVSHSTWMQQLQFIKPALLEKINTFLGEMLIQDIRFKIGKIPSSPSVPPRPPSVEDEPLSPAALKKIETVIQTVSDQEVKKSLREFLIQGAKLEQFRKKDN